MLTHAQLDHEGGLEAVLGAMPVGLLLDGGRGSTDPGHARIVAAARVHGTRVIAGAAGQAFRAGGMRLSVLSPPAGERPDPGEDPNLRAIVLLVSYGSLDFFMPADAESVEIDGMNHAQFGAYGDQSGDGTARISDTDARGALAEAVTAFLAQDPGQGRD